MTEALTQGSDEWHAARCGSLGASVLHEVVARTKSGYSASRANRMATVIVERLTGATQPTFQSQAMLEGTEREPEARSLYEFMTDADVMLVGLVRHPTVQGTHASPDGLIGADGLIEIKCPQPAQHLATLLGEKLTDRYIVQMQWQMACTGRAWCDFVSFNPDFPEAMQLFVQRVKRDDKRITELGKEVVSFLGEVEDKLGALKSRYGGEAPAKSQRLEESVNILGAG